MDFWFIISDGYYWNHHSWHPSCEDTLHALYSFRGLMIFSLSTINANHFSFLGNLWTTSSGPWTKSRQTQFHPLHRSLFLPHSQWHLMEMVISLFHEKSLLCRIPPWIHDIVFLTFICVAVLYFPIYDTVSYKFHSKWFCVHGQTPLGSLAILWAFGDLLSCLATKHMKFQERKDVPRRNNN